MLQSCVLTQGTSDSQVLKATNGKYYYLKDVHKCQTKRQLAASKLMCFDADDVYTEILSPISHQQALNYAERDGTPIVDAVAQTRAAPKAKPKRRNLSHKKAKSKDSRKKVTSRRFGSGPAPAQGEFFARRDSSIIAPDGSTCKKVEDNAYTCTNGVTYRYKGKNKISATDGRECELVKGSWQCKVRRTYVITM
ncbi:MAG: hypothetical protein K6F05_04795 [Succinivibrio sp.]|nr:hypothetical protein [Succinivibrio sp.]